MFFGIDNASKLNFSKNIYTYFNKQQVSSRMTYKPLSLDQKQLQFNQSKARKKNRNRWGREFKN